MPCSCPVTGKCRLPEKALVCKRASSGIVLKAMEA